MKKLLLFSAFLLFSSISSAQKFEWVSHSSQGNVNLDNSPLAVDAAGNSYTAIRTSSYVPVIIQGDTFPVMGNWGDGLCIAKFDPNGALLWGKMYCSYQSFAQSIGVDDAGSVYISTDFGADTTYSLDTIYNNNNIRFQIIKLSANGDFIKTGFINTPGVAPLLAVQGLDLYICYLSVVEKRDSALNISWSQSAVSGTVIFNTNLSATMFVKGATLMITAWEGSAGMVIPFSNDSIYFNITGDYNEAKIIKMDTSGQLLWQYPFPYATNMRAITEDSQGNIYAGVSGINTLLYFANDTLFNSIGPIGYAAIFKWDAVGNPLNALPVYANTGGPVIYDMDVNSSDEVLCTISADNIGLTVINNVTLPLNRALVKLDVNGNVVWVKSTVNNFSNKMVEISVRNGDEYLVSGSFDAGLTCGCILVSSGAYNGNIVAMISEQQEPVPVTDFSYTQAASTVLFKDEIQNATSFQWNFGDALTSVLEQPIHIYAQPGIYNACLTATNACGNNQKCEAIIIKGLRAIVTNHGSTDAVVTADIFGGGFTPATTVLLKKSGSPDIVPYFTNYITDGKLQVRLDLTAQPLGLWDVEVTIPGDTVMTLVNGFTIDTASVYFFDVTYSGPSASRPNRWIPSQIIVHNKSNKDAVGVLVTYRLDATWNSFVNQTFIPPQQIPFLSSGYQYLVTNGLNTSLTNHTFSDTATLSNFGAFIIPLLKANSSYTFPLYLRGSIEIVSAKAVSITGTMLEPSSLIGAYAPSPDLCFSDFFKNTIENVLSISIPAAQWNSCFPPLYDSLLTLTSVQANNQGSSSTPVSLPAAIVSILSAMATSGCITGLPAVLTEAEIKLVILRTLKNIVDTTELHERIPICSPYSQFREIPQTPPSPFRVSYGAFAALECVIAGAGYAVIGAILAPPLAIGIALVVVTACLAITIAVDPNQISGPGNNADDIFQKPGDISAYTVSFENADTATAPAQVVVITDTLDVSKFDMNTFRFTSVTISDSLKFEFTEPGFSQVQVSSLAPFNSDYLRTEATFDTLSGKIQWIFTTVDPVNYQPDTNAIAGFLPPNINGTEGTGYVSYDVKLKSTLVTGDSIHNNAEIIFDTNAPISTNSWLNVIDIDKPISAVNSLPPNISTTSFTVSWSGTDFIAGIRSYSIYVSENDQSYYLWLPVTDTLQYTFNGVNGNKYEFISIAMDNAGNVEDAPLNPDVNPDAVTTIIVGIEEISGNINFSLFPNPVISELLINSTEMIDEINVFDMAGKEISKVKLSKPAVNYQLSTAGLSTGAYFLEIISGGKKGITKFMKVN